MWGSNVALNCPSMPFTVHLVCYTAGGTFCTFCHNMCHLGTALKKGGRECINILYPESELIKMSFYKLGKNWKRQKNHWEQSRIQPKSPTPTWQARDTSASCFSALHWRHSGKTHRAAQRTGQCSHLIYGKSRVCWVCFWPHCLSEFKFMRIQMETPSW